MAESFYARVLSLPLFQGVSSGDLLRLAGTAKFDFRTERGGKLLAAQDETCQSLLFLIAGEVEAERLEDGWALSEVVRAPSVLGVDCLFGLSVRHTHSLRARGNVSLLVTDKRTVREVLLQNATFRINYLNLLSSRVQKLRMWAAQPLPDTADGRLARFLRPLCLNETGEKRLCVRQVDLARLLALPVETLAHTLQVMNRKGLLQTGRGRLVIPQLETLG